MKSVKSLPANPFENADADKVWKELLRKSKPLSREAAMRRMKEATEAQKKNEELLKGVDALKAKNM